MISATLALALLVKYAFFDCYTECEVARLEEDIKASVKASEPQSSDEQLCSKCARCGDVIDNTDTPVEFQIEENCDNSIESIQENQVNSRICMDAFRYRSAFSKIPPNYKKFLFTPRLE